jgi:hypothetical protein
MQRNAGVQVRMLDQQLIPDFLLETIFDFIIFDGAVSYETTPATTFAAGHNRPGILRTQLASEPVRVNDLQRGFEQLWEQADPERPIEE